jgi:hypothetical protein
LGRCKLVDNFRVGPYTAQKCDICDGLYIFRYDEAQSTFFFRLIDEEGEETRRKPYVCPGTSRGNSFSQVDEEVHVARDGRIIYHILAPSGSLQTRRAG